MDVNGWPGEIVKASEISERIAEALAREYGAYITIPRGALAFTTVQ